MRTTIGFLRKGDYFIFDGRKYKVGSLIDGTNGYVACVCVESKRVKRFYIDTTVEKCSGNIEYKGYTVMQVSNFHVWIGKNGKLVLHANCEEEKTDDELRAMVDNYIELTESGKFDEIYNENENSEV